jgi:hypothetical protein
VSLSLSHSLSFPLHLSFFCLSFSPYFSLSVSISVSLCLSVSLSLCLSVFLLRLSYLSHFFSFGKIQGLWFSHGSPGADVEKLFFVITDAVLP